MNKTPIVRLALVPTNPIKSISHAKLVEHHLNAHKPYH